MHDPLLQSKPYISVETVSNPRCSTNGKKSLSLNRSGFWISIQKVAIITSAVLRIVIPRLRRNL